MGDLGLILGLGRCLEKEMATHSSILAWRIPWMEEPGRPQSMGSQTLRHNWETSLSFKILVVIVIGIIKSMAWHCNYTTGNFLQVQLWPLPSKCTKPTFSPRNPFIQEQWFSKRHDFGPGECLTRSGDTFGCHGWRWQGCSQHLEGRSVGWTVFQTKNYPTQNCPQGWCWGLLSCEIMRRKEKDVLSPISIWDLIISFLGPSGTGYSSRALALEVEDEDSPQMLCNYVISNKSNSPSANFSILSLRSSIP